MTDCELYAKFRSEIETMYAPYILKECKEKGHILSVTEDDKKVGLLVVNDGYVDGLYVLPEYRKKGYARKLVLEYVEKYGMLLDLHIMNTNTVARDFWESIFELEPVEINHIDTYYKIKSLKKGNTNS